MPTNETGKKKQRKRKPYGWKQYDGKNLQKPNLWHPGDPFPVTEEDRKMRDAILEAYDRLGYVPAKHEVPNKGPIRSRFQAWSYALSAVGLPPYNDPEEMRRRMAIKEARKWEAVSAGGSKLT